MKTYARIRKLVTVFLLCCACTMVKAQGPGDPGGDPGGGGGTTNVPIDGGLTLLIAAGIGFAAKKSYDKHKKDVAEMNKDKEK